LGDIPGRAGPLAKELMGAGAVGAADAAARFRSANTWENLLSEMLGGRAGVGGVLSALWIVIK
jgi:hypothetical protein